MIIILMTLLRRFCFFFFPSLLMFIEFPVPASYRHPSHNTAMSYHAFADLSHRTEVYTYVVLLNCTCLQ